MVGASGWNGCNCRCPGLELLRLWDAGCTSGSIAPTAGASYRSAGEPGRRRGISALYHAAENDRQSASPEKRCGTILLSRRWRRLCVVDGGYVRSWIGKQLKHGFAGGAWGRTCPAGLTVCRVEECSGTFCRALKCCHGGGRFGTRSGYGANGGGARGWGGATLGGE